MYWNTGTLVASFPQHDMKIFGIHMGIIIFMAAYK
jgi:hypothetical protein